MSLASSLVRAGGLLLVLVPFVPIERLFGSLEDTALGYVGPGEWLLGVFVFGSVGWLLARGMPRFTSAVATGLVRLDGRLEKTRGTPFLLLVGLGGILLFASWIAFRHRPLIVDSVVQLFQAQIFAAGRLTAPPPPGEAFVATQHMLVGSGGWFAQYPPGHAAILAVGVLAGVPWLVPVVLSLATAALIHRFAITAWDARTGRVALGLLLLAPFFWVMGASFMNHVTCLFFAAAFLVCFQTWEGGGRATWALAAGLTTGAAGLSRPLTAIAVAAVFVPIGLAHGIRRGRYASLLLAVVGGLIPVGAYLAYNAATTGHALVPGYLALWGESHGVGFHTSPWGEAHTPWSGLRNELIDLSMLAGFFLEWPISALLPAGLYTALSGGRDVWDRRMMAGLFAIPAAYFFYWHRDPYLGPRFLYSTLLFLVPLTARGLLALSELPSGRLRLRETATLVVLMCFAYAVLYSAPRRLSVYGSTYASMKVDLPALADEAGIERGVVFVAVSWGNRLLARMRGAGVEASTAEVVYRGADHCDIEQSLRRAREEGWLPKRTSSVLGALERGRAEQAALNGDPTLRLTPGRPLAPVCRAELAHDLAGYGNWLPFLLANDPGLDGAVLYVRDLRDLNVELLTRRPGREAWLFRPTGLQRLDVDRAVWDEAAPD
jgi:hypothetical protein